MEIAFSDKAVFSDVLVKHGRTEGGCALALEQRSHNHLAAAALALMFDVWLIKPPLRSIF